MAFFKSIERKAVGKWNSRPINKPGDLGTPYDDMMRTTRKNGTAKRRKTGQIFKAR